MNYVAQVNREAQRRQWAFTPKHTFDRHLHGRVYIALHLYSGRRRPDDWHAHLQDQLPLPGLEIIVISLDTAIKEEMDVHSERIWAKLVHAADDRRICGILLGPPCESWSSARHEALLSPTGALLRGPRPLRSAEAPWGLQQLSFRELNQILVGSGLLLKGAWLAIMVALTGSVAILEHPALPYQEDRASIWRTGLFRALLRHSWLFRLCTIFQWRFGAAGSKPTALLYAGVSLPGILRQHEVAGLSKPAAHLIGQRSDGSFATSAAKEYLGPLNRGFASAMISWLKSSTSRAAAEPDLRWAFEFAAQSADCDQHAQTSWKPDYQPV
eukprot:Skav227086  [mRNA]  locus=scaffold1387:298718:299698:+ [translate_table: standard]